MPSAMRVLAFCRYPEPGQVKTRLAKDVGPSRAGALYRAFVQDVLDALHTAGARVTLCVTPDRRAEDYTTWLGKGRSLVLQEGQDLGQRMANAFRHAFNQGDEQALLVGTDIPQLSPTVLHQAWRELRRVGLVLGPAADGGYYLIGLRRDSFDTSLFQGVSWSTRHVLQQTLARTSRGGRHALLPTLRDCDDLEDLRCLLSAPANGLARATRRQARALGLV